MITYDFTEKVVGATGGGHDSCLSMERSNEATTSTETNERANTRIGNEPFDEYANERANTRIGKRTI